MLHLETSDEMTRKGLESEAMDIQQRIRTLRKQRGLSAEEVAREMGISRPYYTLLEGAKRRLSAEHLEKIARVFGVSVGELYGDKTSPRGMRTVGGPLKGKHVRPINAPELRKRVEPLLGDRTDDFLACYQAWVQGSESVTVQVLRTSMAGDRRVKAS